MHKNFIHPNYYRSIGQNNTVEVHISAYKRFEATRRIDMKRFLAIAAAAALMLSLTACGGRRNNSSDAGSSTVTSGDNSGGTAANGSADDKDSGMNGGANNNANSNTSTSGGSDITDGNTESNAPDGIIDPSTGEGAIIGGGTEDPRPASPTTNDGTIDARMRS